MCAVYKEEALSEKALLKHLDGKADGKKVAKAEKKVAVSEEAVVSEEAGETEDTHPKPEPETARLCTAAINKNKMENRD